jgi:hypothetical protein
VREQTAASPANTDQRLREAEQAARDQAARDQAARDQAARDQAARDEAARAQAARDAAAREQARTSAVDQAARDRAAIEDLVRQYAEAYSRLDEARLRAIDPGFRRIERKELIRSVELSFSQRSIEISPDGQSATLKAAGTFAYVWNRANLPGSSPARLVWNLRKSGTTWTVVP